MLRYEQRKGRRFAPSWLCRGWSHDLQSAPLVEFPRMRSPPSSSHAGQVRPCALGLPPRCPQGSKPLSCTGFSARLKPCP